MTKTDNAAWVPTTRMELGRFQPYQPGLSIERISRQYGLKNVIKLASNENALGASKKALSAYRKAAARLFRYPETGSVDLRRAVAERFRVDAGEVIIGGGSDDIIEMLAKAFLRPEDQILVSATSFIQYRNGGDLMGADVLTVPMRHFRYDLAEMARAAGPRTKLAFIANPNNPTGTYATRSEVAAFLDALPRHVIPVFDEAYFEFARTEADYPSVAEEFFRRRPLIVLRTFSKAFGLAGLRVGYALGHEKIIAALDRIRLPFNVSIPAQAAALAALGDRRHIARSVANNERERGFLRRAMESFGFVVVPSAANFLLFDVAPWKGRDLFERLLRKGMIIRHTEEYGLPHHVRVSVGTHRENMRFLNALREVIAQP